MIGLIVFLGLVFLILIHELGHFLAAKMFGIRVDEFGIFFPPRIISKKYKGTVYSLNWLPFGGFVRIFGESPLDEVETEEDKKKSFAYQKPWKKAVVLSAGVFINLIAAWFLFSIIFLLGTESFIAVQSVSKDSPAAEAGMIPGDIIRDFKSIDEFISHIDYMVINNPNESLTIPIKRAGEDIEVVATPRVSPPEGEGPLGVGLGGGGIEQVSFPFNFYQGLIATISSLQAIFFGFISMITSIFVGVVPDVAGPIGIFSIAYQIGSNGFIFLLHLIAIISVNLVILNLLPFPALDGGRLLFLLIEKIKGSPMPKVLEGYANLVGFLLLLLLMVLVTIKDIFTFL